MERILTGLIEAVNNLVAAIKLQHADVEALRMRVEKLEKKGCNCEKNHE